MQEAAASQPWRSAASLRSFMSGLLPRQSQLRSPWRPAAIRDHTPQSRQHRSLAANFCSFKDQEATLSGEAPSVPPQGAGGGGGGFCLEICAPLRGGVLAGSGCFRHGQVFPSRSENMLRKLFFRGVVVIGVFLAPPALGSGACAVTGFGFVGKRPGDRGVTGSLA